MMDEAITLYVVARGLQFYHFCHFIGIHKDMKPLWESNGLL